MRFVQLLILVALLQACNNAVITNTKDANPAAIGFDHLNSDSLAIKVADQVMEAMGGRANWDKSRFIHWSFFGARNHIWDKYTGDVEITSFRKDTSVFQFNLFSMEGDVFISGKKITEPDSLKILLEKGMDIWINDSYWLVMPYKLKDTGVTLNHLGMDTTNAGINAEVICLTFKETGRTPQNKYFIYVDTVDHLVKQWDFYNKAKQDTPNFTTPWDDYNLHGDILLSASRGENYILDGIKVSSTSPKNWWSKVD
ncbi:MAG: hypothetical protein ACJAZ3_000252 [Sphingobacteriales bacterium]|jgi:hypothetical protein